MTSPFDAWKKLALSAAIVVALNVFLYAGIDTFYPQPQYEDFCPIMPAPTKEAAIDQKSCNLDGGNWVLPAVGDSYCEMAYKAPDQECNTAYNDATQPRQRNTFLMMTVFGFLALLAGMTIKKFPMSVGRGLSYGGVAAMFLGTASYWGSMADYWRFIVSAVILVILIWVGMKKVQD